MLAADDRPSADARRRARVAVLRGDALNPFELQAYEPLIGAFDLLAVGRRGGPHETGLIGIPTRLLPSLSEYRLLRAGLRRVRQLNLLKHDPHRLLGLRTLVRDFDILHAAETAIPLSEQAAELCLASRSRLILTCWETIPFRFDDDRILSQRKAFVRNNTALFIAVTERARAALLCEGVAADRIAVVPAGVDCDRFHPGVDGREWRRRRGISASALLVVYVGRLIQEKGVVELLRAFSASAI